MQTHLRPMSLGEILDRTAQLYRTHFALFAGISALYAGAVMVLNLGNIGLQQLLLHLHMPKQLPLASGGFALLIFPLILIFAVFAVAANNRAVAWLNLDQPATIRGAYRSILPRLGRYIWLTLIVLFIVYTPFAVLFAAYAVFLFRFAISRHLFAPGQANADPSGLLTVGLVTFGFGVLALGALIYAVLMGLRYSLAVPASVVEDLPARKAIRRSIELSKGSRGRIFMLALLISAIQTGLAIVTQIFFIIAAVKHRGVLPVWAQILQQIVAFLTNTFIGPMFATGLTLFYYDQRIRKEGFDIEWMMQAAGMTAPAASEPAQALEHWPEPPSEASQPPVPPDPPEAAPEAATEPETPPEGQPEIEHG